MIQLIYTSRALPGDCPAADDVALCVSERAINATLHSNSRMTGGTFTVRAALRPGDHARVEVEDSGGLWAPKPSGPDRGHGLDIVRALGYDWGIDGDGQSRAVWARFDWATR